MTKARSPLLKWSFILAIFGSMLLVNGQKRTKSETLRLLNDIPLDRTLPSLDSKEPTIIKCDLLINNIDSINEANMDFTVDVVIHLSWQNKDLMKKIRTFQFDFDYLDFDATNMEKVWVPDVYFPNEKKASVHQVMMANKMMRFYKDSTVSYIVRASVTLSCRMDLRKYPFDKQVCSIMMESFGFSSNKLVLNWDTDLDNPVDSNNIKELRQFRMLRVDHKNYIRSHNITGNHSCLRADFHLVRNIGYYVVQMYIPSLLIVVLSWLSFWLNANSTPGRVTLGVLSVLTISTQSSGVNASLPRVSYTKAIDVWMATCLVFAFASLIEFAIVNVFSRKLPGRRCSLFNLFTVQKDEQEEKETTVYQDGKVSLEPNPSPKSRIVMCSTTLDVASRVMFPVAFGIFNMVYWIYYLNVMEYSV